MNQLAKIRIKKNDIVKVMAGRENGKRGKILMVFPKEQSVIVEKLNIIKRHTRPSQQVKQGGIIEKEMPIHISNVALLNPVTNKPDRVGYRVLEDKRKVRYFKSNNEVVDI